MSFDIEKVRADFPELHQNINNSPLVYLDNAASTLKARPVIDAIKNHYELGACNIHRGVHYLSEKATREFEEARVKLQKFINAKSDKEIILTKGTTDSINLVANSFGQKFIKAGDEIIISHMEHHSNIVPWQLLCERVGATLKVAPINEHGELIFDEYKKLLTEKTKLVSMVYVSNSLGTINPIKQVIDAAHEVGAKVLVDGAQAVAHKQVDVQALDCDFFAFSGHKIFAPTGTGVLYGKEALLEEMPPYQGGGDMIDKVSFDGTTWAELPSKFEAGTPHIGGVIGFGAAIDYVQSLGLDNIYEYEKVLLDRATAQLKDIKKVRLIGTARDKASVCAFLIDGVHPTDYGTFANQEGIAVRTGHHCTQPIMQHFGITGTIRASFSLYNTVEEVDKFAKSIVKTINFFT